MSRPSSPIAIVWFRNDLRIGDNPALQAAVDVGAAVIPLYILDETLGGAGRWWLHHSLERLGADLAARGARLVLRRGDPEAIVPDLVAETGAGAVYWNRVYEGPGIARDMRIKATLKDRGIAARSFNGCLLREPWEVETKAGTPYTVFTPFWKACRALKDPAHPLPALRNIPGVDDPPSSDALGSWRLVPRAPNWAAGWEDLWSPGEEGAKVRLAAFLDEDLASYREQRDRPDRQATSRLSPHLRFGEISPRQVWHWTLDHVNRADGRGEAGAWAFLRELGWRDFNHNLLFHNPDLGTENFRSDFDDFPWRDGPETEAAFRAWCQGRTGYPLVDAGMRELWRTGFMHNRVRMVTASFLVKHLLIDWRRGEAWFRDTLVDACPANNTANWQWVAGSGADAAPYFRIFNPTTQAEKFDPKGRYIRRWVPELEGLPDDGVAAPWAASVAVLKDAGITLGEDYPKPIVDHRAARERALSAYDEIKGNSDKGAA